MTANPLKKRLRPTIFTMTRLEDGFEERLITPQPLPENLPGSGEKTKLSKKLSATLFSKENQRKKISLAREIVEHSPWLSKRAIAKNFGIARSTLYRKSKMSEKDKIYLEQILEIMREHPGYGKPSIALEMGRNIKLVRRVMSKYGLKGKKHRKRFKKPKDERKSASGIPNRINNLSPICPNAFWVGDFTHFDFHGRFFYLATVLDLYTREVIGWATGLYHTAELVIEALNHAKSRRGLSRIFHSDQGSEYDSTAFKARLLAYQVLPSHSEKSSPWQNGHQESFFGRFKEEFGNVNRFQSLDELIEAIYRQIHYYNTRRMHRKIKMPPLQKYLEALRENLLPEQWLKTREKSESESVA